MGSGPSGPCGPGFSLHNVRPGQAPLEHAAVRRAITATPFGWSRRRGATGGTEPRIAPGTGVEGVSLAVSASRASYASVAPGLTGPGCFHVARSRRSVEPVVAIRRTGWS
jgi:hypothetical protein